MRGANNLPSGRGGFPGKSKSRTEDREVRIKDQGSRNGDRGL